MGIVILGTLLFSSVLFASQPAFAQTVDRAHSVADFDTNSPRPLNDALAEIEVRLGVPINYQESAVNDSQNLVKGEEIGLSPGKFYQKSQHFHVHYVLGESDALSATKTAVNAYQEARLPGQYKVVSEGSAFYVIPLGDASLFDTKITLSAEERRISDLLKMLSLQIAKTTTKKIVLLTVPDSMGAKFSVAAHSEPLTKVLEQIDHLFGPILFRFVYEPSTDTYYLNASSVPRMRSEDLEEKSGTAPTMEPLSTANPFSVKTQ
jgi:hypothetical protein